jgi:hypothetical protein
MASSARTYATARQLVLDHYGRICACCGAWRCLTIDHINGDGAQHRAQIGGLAGREFYRWLIRNNYPAGFGTLCHNCNASKKRSEFCGLHRKLLVPQGVS